MDLINSKCNKLQYIGCYYPIEGEVDTIAIIDELLKNDFKVCLPVIEKNQMVFKPITTLQFPYDF